MGEDRSSIVQHENVDAEYLSRRKLQQSAGWVLLWALGVGAVISGDFAGWNAGLEHGGFWGLAIATALMTAMYVCMVFSIAELSAALPHAGGFASFARNALGPLGGFICGVTVAIEYVVTPAVIVYFIGGYMHTVVEGAPDYVWWLVFYGIFVTINIWGVELTLRVSLMATLVAMAVLVLFFVSVLTTGAFHWENLFNVQPDPGQSAQWLPKGWYGVFAALPFAIWFFLAIEQLPLAAEEAHDVVSDVPRALIWGIATLVILAVLTLVLNTGIEGGAALIGGCDAPLAEGFRAVFGAGVTTKAITLFALTGLIASFHSTIYAYGRILFALSRAGYFPRWISLTNRNHTPGVALIVGMLAGLACTFLLKYAQTTVGPALLNMAVFGAVISYVIVMVSYIRLALDRPSLTRPYRSPLGMAGAVVGTVLSVVALAATFASQDYRPAVLGVAAFVAVAIAFFLLHSRHCLVAQAPEEEAALIAQAERELV